MKNLCQLWCSNDRVALLNVLCYQLCDVKIWWPRHCQAHCGLKCFLLPYFCILGTLFARNKYLFTNCRTIDAKSNTYTTQHRKLSVGTYVHFFNYQHLRVYLPWLDFTVKSCITVFSQQSQKSKKYCMFLLLWHRNWYNLSYYTLICINLPSKLQVTPFGCCA